jgi:predicted Zn-dependent protease
MSFDLSKILQSLNVQADWIGLREIKERADYRVVRNGRPDQNISSIDHGVMVEVLIDGQFAYYGTNSLSLSAIQNAAEIAVSLAQKAGKWKLHSFTAEQRPKAVGQYQSPRTIALDQLSAAQINDHLIKASNAMQLDEKIINSVAQVMLSTKETHFVSSNGSDFYQNISATSLTLSATAQDGSEIQTRTNGNQCLQAGLEILNNDIFEIEGLRIGQEALELLKAEECPTGNFDLILEPDQLYLQVHESIGHPLELDRILGDERNYAGWSFVKPEDFGTLEYGSPLLSVTFDPGVSGELACYRFDDTGNDATKEYLIQNGKLLRGLGSLESQTRSHIPGVANARATSWNRPPIDRMANINIEAGNTPLETMISEVETGILMSTNRSWSIDDYRNKFQFGCEYAKLIENGKLTKTLKNPNYRGITIPFWKSLKRVGNAPENWGSFFCGKGEPNQIIRVGHTVPACLFTNVEVFGGS